MILTMRRVSSSTLCNDEVKAINFQNEMRDVMKPTLGEEHVDGDPDNCVVQMVS